MSLSKEELIQKLRKLPCETLRSINDIYNYVDDEEVMHVALSNVGKLLEYASDRLKNNKPTVLAAVTNKGSALQYASNELKNDKDVVLAAIEQDCYALRYASDELENDKTVILRAVSIDGCILRDVADHFKNDPIVVSAAVSNDGEALQYASEELKENKKIVMTAIENNQLAYKSVGKKLKFDEEIILNLIDKDPIYYNQTLTAPELNTIHFTIKAIFKNPKVLPLICTDIKIHPQIKWLRRNIFNMPLEHRDFIQSVYLKYPNAFLNPDKEITPLLFGNPDDYMILANYIMVKYDKETKNKLTPTTNITIDNII